MLADTAPKKVSCENIENDFEEPVEETNLRFSSDHIEQILHNLYLEGKNGLREVDIVNAYIGWLKEHEGIEYTYSEKQPTTHKALKALGKKGIVKKINMRYFLVISDTQKDVAEKVLINQVKLQSKRVFTISASTVVLRPTDDTASLAKKELYNFLGSSCYGIMLHDGFLVIMLVGDKDKLKALRDGLKELADKIYNKKDKQ